MFAFLQNINHQRCKNLNTHQIVCCLNLFAIYSFKVFQSKQKKNIRENRTYQRQGKKAISGWKSLFSSSFSRELWVTWWNIWSHSFLSTSGTMWHGRSQNRQWLYIIVIAISPDDDCYSGGRIVKMLANHASNRSCDCVNRILKPVIHCAIWHCNTKLQG